MKSKGYAVLRGVGILKYEKRNINDF
jgi:hypothetical protein